MFDQLDRDALRIGLALRAHQSLGSLARELQRALFGEPFKHPCAPMLIAILEKWALGLSQRQV
jgi:hypothetical protein